MDRTSRVALLAMPSLFLACDHTYLPRIPPHNSSGDVWIQLNRIYESANSKVIHGGMWSGTALYEFAVSAPPSTRLVAVSLTKPESSPCRRGADANAVRIDHREVLLSGPVLVSGAHRLVARFEVLAQRPKEAQAMDFEFEGVSGALCERVNVTEIE